MSWEDMQEKAAKHECQRVDLSIRLGQIVGTFTGPGGRWGFTVARYEKAGQPAVEYRVWVNCDAEGNGPGSLEVIRLTPPDVREDPPCIQCGAPESVCECERGPR